MVFINYIDQNSASTSSHGATNDGSLMAIFTIKIGRPFFRIHFFSGVTSDPARAPTVRRRARGCPAPCRGDSSRHESRGIIRPFVWSRPPYVSESTSHFLPDYPSPSAATARDAIMRVTCQKSTATRPVASSCSVSITEGISTATGDHFSTASAELSQMSDESPSGRDWRRPANRLSAKSPPSLRAAAGEIAALCRYAVGPRVCHCPLPLLATARHSPR